METLPIGNTLQGTKKNHDSLKYFLEQILSSEEKKK